jgi:hypothetical protein
MSFNDLISSLGSGSFGSFGLVDVFFALTIPAVLCTGVVYTYKKAQLHASFSPSFLLMLFMFASLSGGVTLFIGENVARAFGLVGAMSIIRFRNALKEPIDAVFVLWALTIGMACGSGYYLAGAFLTLVVSGITLAVKALGLANFEIDKTVLKVVTNQDQGNEILSRVETKLNGYTKEYKVLHEMSNQVEKTRTHVYTLTPRKNVKISDIEEQISSVEGAKVYGSIYRPSVGVME